MNLFTARSDRVKCVDFHPTEPWVLVSLYSGHVNIWNYQTQSLVKSIEVCDQPVRTARFIARKSWIIAGADDLVIRVYNYNTLEKVASFDGHSDYIRMLTVHPSRPIVLSSSDDMTVKMWDWEKGWKCTQTFEGHQHYVMDVVFNPKDPNTFATASLDRTIKVWSLTSAKANYTLEGHEKGINCLAYYPGADKPYLVSGADDHSVRVWDYQNKACVRVLEGHTLNVSSVVFHPELPIILSGSEDCTMKVWSASTFRLEASYSMTLDRIWSIAHGGSSDIAIGCDDGVLVIQLGKGEPTASMDSNGKVIWAKHNEVLTCNLQTVQDLTSQPEGERVLVATKELGHCEILPQTLQHSPNGRFVVVCGDGEYIIYTALAWRSRAFGKGLDFAWAADSNEYAVKDSGSRIVLFSNFTESGSIRLSSNCDRIFGGHLLGIACSGSQLCFYDWSRGILLRRIDVEASRIYWSPSGDRIAVCSEDSAFILAYHPEIVQAYLDQGIPIPEDGIEEAFELVDEIPERIVSGLWLESCFVFVNSNNRVSYHVGSESAQVAIHDRPIFLLGYLDNRLILTDKDANIVTFVLATSVIQYQGAVLRGDKKAAAELIPHIPADQRNRVARFLESQGDKAEAFNLATDPDYRFDLALGLDRLDVAFEIVNSSNNGTDHKWRLLGDKALAGWKIGLAEKCFWKGNDLTSLLLLYSASGNQVGLVKLAQAAIKEGQSNIAFTCYYSIGDKAACFDLLMTCENYAEAALFARAHLPARLEEATKQWKAALKRSSLTSITQHVEKQASESLAVPSEQPDAFSIGTYEAPVAVAVSAEPIAATVAGHVAAEPVTVQPVVQEVEHSVQHEPEPVVAEVEQPAQEEPEPIPIEPAPHVEPTPIEEPTVQAVEAVPIAVPDSIPSVPSFFNEPRPRAVSFDKSVDENAATVIPGSSFGMVSGTTSVCDGASDHMSLEVNTTGTGSIRATDDLDELTSMRTAGMDMERLTIHDELPEDEEAAEIYNPKPSDEGLFSLDESAQTEENKPATSPLHSININGQDDDWL